jgi:AcrR family transcriptional regulator
MKNKSYHQEDLREKLIEKAKEVFISEDLKAVTVRRISKELDVSPMAFYHYFKDLKEFIHELAIGFIVDLEVISKKAMSSDLSGYPKLYRLGYEYVNYALQNPKPFLLMFRPEYGSAVKFDWQKTPLYRVLMETVVEILPSDSSPQKAQICALSAWSLVHGLAMLLIDGPFSAMQDNPQMLDQVIIKTLKNIDFKVEAEKFQ